MAAINFGFIFKANDSFFLIRVEYFFKLIEHRGEIWLISIGRVRGRKQTAFERLKIKVLGVFKCLQFEAVGRKELGDFASYFLMSYILVIGSVAKQKIFISAQESC